MHTILIFICLLLIVTGLFFWNTKKDDKKYKEKTKYGQILFYLGLVLAIYTIYSYYTEKSTPLKLKYA